MSWPAHARSPWFRFAICLLGLSGLPACTTVNVYAGDGSVAVHRGFGFVNLQPALGSTPMVFRGTSLGLQSGPWGHSLGYTQTSLALLPAGCHIVVMPANEPQASSPALQALRAADPCAAPTPALKPTPGGD
jgi:hypothetical protein